MTEQPSTLITQKTIIVILLTVAVIAIGWKLWAKSAPNNQKPNPTQVPTLVPTKPQTQNNQEASGKPQPTKNANTKQYSSPPPMQIDQNKKYTAKLVTSKGDITIELFAKETPITVNNFVFLAREGFYNGTIFHRVIKGFMIQGGDPQGTGAGGPGYKFNDEPITRKYLQGTVAMANAGPNTNGSQFFIMHQDNPNLPKNYVIFGQVVGGMDMVDKIANTPVKVSAFGERSQPIATVILKTVEIKEK